MKLYDMVQLKEQFNNYPKGITGVIVEIFENTDAYLEIVDDAGNTIDVIYDVPLSILEKKKITVAYLNIGCIEKIESNNANYER